MISKVVTREVSDWWLYQEWPFSDTWGRYRILVINCETGLLFEMAYKRGLVGDDWEFLPVKESR